MGQPQTIPSDQIAYRKRIGNLGTRPVLEYGLVGGLHLVVAPKAAGGIETLGTGSHPAIAKFIAQRHAPDIRFDDLAKAAEVDPRDFAELLPRYVALTDELRKLG